MTRPKITPGKWGRLPDSHKSIVAVGGETPDGVAECYNPHDAVAIAALPALLEALEVAAYEFGEAANGNQRSNAAKYAHECAVKALIAAGYIF
jgi:hypothetical protein